MQYCRLIKEHDDDKSELCVNSYKAKSDQSVTQCRQVLGHKGSNALMTEPLVAPNGGALVAPNGREEEV